MPEPIPTSYMAEPPNETAKCVRLVTGPESSERQPLSGPERDPELAHWLDPVPPDVRRTVLAAGLEPALARLLRDREAGLSAMNLTVRRHAIALHLLSLKVQVDATSFEADCTGDLVEGLQATLDEESHSREMRWTVASIVTGAAAAVGAGAWELADSESNAPAVIGISGGVASAGLGLAAFNTVDRPVVLEHRRNLLTPIVQGEDRQHVYPSFVFRLLTLPQAGQSTPREMLSARFDTIVESAVESNERERAETLLYGNGGVYNRRLVDAREVMLDEIESTVAAFARDLEMLARYLNRALGDDCIAPSSTEGCTESH